MPSNAIARSLDLVGRFGRPLTLANIAAQGIIIVTGAAVRLTESGLGCSTWPECEPGTITPAEATFHAVIEFGNRTLTGVLLIIAVLTAVAVWRTRRDLLLLGLAPLVGVVLQAVLGGITVLTGLNPWVVAGHLWLSAILVWVSVWLALAYRRAPRREGASLAGLRWIQVAATALVVFLGTVTTGTGPHSGDAEAARLPYDLETVARVHAGSAWLFVIVLLVMIWMVRRDRSAGDGRDEVRPAWIVLAIVTLLQGVIGYVQYFTDLPEVLVGAHLAGVAILVAAQSAAFYLLSPAKARP